jgi:hypothetical protein
VGAGATQRMTNSQKAEIEMATLNSPFHSIEFKIIANPSIGEKQWFY